MGINPVVAEEVILHRGIGGGGAGGASGDTAFSGAGFTCGVPERNSSSIGGVNGNTLNFRAVYCIGGSYYGSYASTEWAVDYQTSLFNYENYSRAGRNYGTDANQEASGGIGGGCCVPDVAWYEDERRTRYISDVVSSVGWPDGGDAGKGGTITVSENAVVRGYNGSYITTKDSSAMTTEERINTQALIYAQAGYDVKAIRELCEVKIVNARTISDLVSEWSATGSNYASYRTISSPYDSTCGTALEGKYILGIGSGAGSAQVASGNGTYTIDSSLN